ncbi:MAG: hypothetical protein ABI333_24850 [bacterium]
MARLVGVTALALLALGCAGNELPDKAPDFTLVDINPSSPTAGEERSLSETRGKVMILYFVSFG